MSEALKDLTKEIRENRNANFKENWLLELAEITEVFERENGSYSFSTGKFGTIDFFPKANKLLIRKQNKWIKPGLKWIIKNILK